MDKKQKSSIAYPRQFPFSQIQKQGKANPYGACFDAQLLWGVLPTTSWVIPWTLQFVRFYSKPYNFQKN